MENLENLEYLENLDSLDRIIKKQFSPLANQRGEPL